MRTLRVLMKLFLKNELRLSHIESVSIKLRWLKPVKSFFFDRLHLIVNILICPFFWLIRLKKINYNIILVFECYKRDEEIVTDHIYYFRKTKKQDNSYLPVYILDMAKPNITIDNKTSLDQVLNCLKIWFVFLIIGFYSFFDKERKPLRWLTVVLNYLISFELLKKSIKETYFFKGRYRITSYLSALLISYMYENIEINIFLGNNPLFTFSRLNYIKNANLIVQNPLVYEEALQFQEKKWFSAKKIYLENEYGYKNINKSLSRYDIGIYSSGSWARHSSRQELISDVDYLKNQQDYTNNLYYKYFVEILTGIIDLKTQYPHLRIKIYTHPHERFLYSQHNLFPCYYILAQENGIIVDLEGKNSMGKIYESKIGISVMSDITFERFNFGLISFMLANDYTKQFFNPKYFGKYKKYFFYNIKELINKLKEELSI